MKTNKNRSIYSVRKSNTIKVHLPVEHSLHNKSFIDKIVRKRVKYAYTRNELDLENGNIVTVIAYDKGGKVLKYRLKVVEPQEPQDDTEFKPFPTNPEKKLGINFK